jgi:hypothetical protein
VSFIVLLCKFSLCCTVHQDFLRLSSIHSSWKKLLSRILYYVTNSIFIVITYFKNSSTKEEENNDVHNLIDVTNNHQWWHFPEYKLQNKYLDH